MKEELNAIFKSKDLQDVSLETIESLLDNQISNEVIKGIPILNAIKALKNVYSGITDRIFIKKAMSVLYELKEVSQQDRVKLLSDLSDNFESGVEKLMMAIDKLESTEKCIIYGRLLFLRTTDKIDVDSFKRFTKLIQDAYLPDLTLIRDFKDNKGLDNSSGNYATLISLSLIRQGGFKEGLAKGDKNIKGTTSVIGNSIDFGYYPTNLGNLLLSNYDYLFPEWNVE